MSSRFNGFTSRLANDCLGVLERDAGVESKVLLAYFFAPSLHLIFG
jgi:hypothetical protein